MLMLLVMMVKMYYRQSCYYQFNHKILKVCWTIFASFSSYEALKEIKINCNEKICVRLTMAEGNQLV